MANDERQILTLFEDGDHALVAADMAALSRIFADDYIQGDDCGQFFTKLEVIENLKTGAIRYISIRSTGRRIRLFGDFAIVNGSEEDEVEQGGKRLSVRYVYMDVVAKRDGAWQIVASQLAKLPEKAKHSE